MEYWRQGKVVFGRHAIVVVSGSWPARRALPSKDVVSQTKMLAPSFAILVLRFESDPVHTGFEERQDLLCSYQSYSLWILCFEVIESIGTVHKLRHFFQKRATLRSA